MWPFKKSIPTSQTVEPWSLSTPLLHWSKYDDPWTIGSAVEGTLILGATGSGKTSGSGRAIMLSFLRAGFGGLVLTAKADERQLIESYCRETHRLKDLLIFGTAESLRFNFLDYELKRKGTGAGLTENIVNLFSIVLEIAERNSAGGGGREDEGYWRRAARQLCRNLVDLLILAKGRISIPDLYRLVVSAPTSMDQIRSDMWKEQSFCFKCLGEADKRQKTEQQQIDFSIVADYFLLEFPSLSEKTRSVVVSTFTSMVDVLNRGILRELFCTDTNVTPEVCENGEIICIDLPVKEFSEVGLFAQVLWKHAFQKSIERRDITTSPRPVFLWADEAQNFVTSGDMQFQTTARSARVATVLLSQNVSNFYAALGAGDKGKAEADSIFGNLNTRIFHANSDPVTNTWAADVIGRSRQFLVNASQNSQCQDLIGSLTGLGAPAQATAGVSETLQYDIEPSRFGELRTGGIRNAGMVDAIIVQNGRRFRSSGRTWMQTTFSQRSP